MCRSLMRFDENRDSNNRLLENTFQTKLSHEIKCELGLSDNVEITCAFSNRIYFNYNIYHSKNYTRCSASCDYYIKYAYGGIIDNFGIIENFFEFKNNLYVALRDFKCSSYDFFEGFTIENRKELENENFFNLYFIILFKSQHIRVIKAANILNKCVVIKINSKEFITEFLYDREHD